jgi:hypothetical protein
MAAYRVSKSHFKIASSPWGSLALLVACSNAVSTTNWPAPDAGGAPETSGGPVMLPAEAGGIEQEASAPELPETGGAPEAPEAAADDAGNLGHGGDAETIDDGSYGSLDGNYGGVGQMPPIPIPYPPQPVPPIIAPECPGDPTMGFKEYTDTFVIQRPYDLAASDRFSYENGIFTFWVLPTDKPHVMGNTTAPRTEARYSDMSTGTRIWSADIMFESPLNDTCVMQIHNVVGAIAAYYRVIGGRMFNLGTGQTVLTDYYNKWFNFKVVFNMQTLQVNAYVNNCLKETHTAPNGPTPNWYFKNGVYTCQATICRDHFKNLHLYQQ